MKLYTAEFLEGLSDDPKLALYDICIHFLNEKNKSIQSVDESLEAFALIETFVSANSLDIEFPKLKKNDASFLIREITSFINKIRVSLNEYVNSSDYIRTLDKFRTEFSIHLENVFVYEFSTGDLARIRILLNELREHIINSNVIEEEHRRRLLKRVEKLQQELHKKQTDLSHFWGLLGDAGVAIKKFGKDAKPIVDRIRELTEIAWRTQARAEELPSDSKFPSLDNDNQEEGKK